MVLNELASHIPWNCSGVIGTMFLSRVGIFKSIECICYGLRAV